MERLDEFLSALLQVYGPELMRYKGFVWVAGVGERVVLQGVHMLMGTDLGTRWEKDEARESCVVFIGKNLPSSRRSSSGRRSSRSIARIAPLSSAMTIGSTNGPVAAAPRPADRARGEHASHIVNCLWTGMLPVPTSRKLELLPHELLDVAGVFSRATLAAGTAPIVP